MHLYPVTLCFASCMLLCECCPKMLQHEGFARCIFLTMITQCGVWLALRVDVQQQQSSKSVSRTKDAPLWCVI